MNEALRPISLMVFDVDGVLADGSIIYAAPDTDIKRFNSKDGFGIAMARHAEIKVAILTARHSKAVEARAKELQFDYYESGHFYKRDALHHIMTQAGVSKEQTLYMGDDILDLVCLPDVGVFAAPKNAVPRVRQLAHWVGKKKGGKGAVREIIEAVLTAQQRLDSIERHFY
jgi:3-deoxy-D-manno-octulosonate 8-phosphate phosphatase (KDO 8-P phosphatase)